MEEKDRKSINIIGLVAIVVSSLMIFSNSVGALAFTFIGVLEENSSEEVPMNGLEFIFRHYVELCLLMIAFGISLLIGGIFLRKFKLWANRWVSLVAALMLVVLWITGITLLTATLHTDVVFGAMTIVTTIVWSGPIVLLIWFLNKKRIKTLFS